MNPFPVQRPPPVDDPYREIHQATRHSFCQRFPAISYLVGCLAILIHSISVSQLGKAGILLASQNGDTGGRLTGGL